MQRYVGIDFGTTNSAIAVATADGPPRLLEFPSPSGATASTWRSVLYFEPESERTASVSAGSLAIGRYLESGGDGRLIQSVKSHLASRHFSKTSILSRNYSLEDLVSTFLLQMRRCADVDLGSRAVVGRPVRYWGADGAEDDERAVTRMLAGLAQAGFDDVVLELEPTAAAARYGSELDRDELVLIADFGGGTSDFCLLEMGPGKDDTVLATGGVGIGGDTFDGCVIDSLVAPLLGKGTSYADAFGGEVEVPRSLYANLRRWHHLAFLKSQKTMALLDRVHHGAREPELIDRFIHVVEHDLGLPLHQAVERTKVELSRAAASSLDFCDPPIEIAAPVDRESFDDWIEADLARIDEVIDQVLGEAGVEATAIGRVFATGGSSLVPAVRNRLEARFPGRLVGGGELTSVALGLAERARTIFRTRR